MMKTKESEYGVKVKSLVHVWTGALARNHPGEWRSWDTWSLLTLQILVITLCVPYLACYLAGVVLCVTCHPFEASFAHAAMLEDTLTRFLHHVYYATLKDNATATNRYEVNGRCLLFFLADASTPPPLFFFPCNLCQMFCLFFSVGPRLRTNLE